MDPMYALGSSKPIGIACLIGSSRIKAGQVQLSVSKDIEELVTTLETVGLETLQETREELTSRSLEEVVQKLRSIDYTKYPSLMLYCTGYGDARDIRLSDGVDFAYSEVVHRICTLPTLEGKPKVFIFDSCRGSHGTKRYISRHHYKLEKYKDCLVTVAYNAAEKDFILDHAIFKKTFCSALMKYHRRWPLVSILLHAQRITQGDIDTFCSESPQIEVGLQKQLYLCYDHYVVADRSSNVGQLKPSLLLLYKLIPTFSNYWYYIGLELLGQRNENMLYTIRINLHQDAYACSEMLRRWLETKHDASWNQLLEALNKMGVASAANEVKILLRSEIGHDDRSTASYLCCDNSKPGTVSLKCSGNDYQDAPPINKISFKSREDVINNRGSLGGRQRVFICYTPSSGSSGSTRQAGKLEGRVYTFARHLITYGFEVVVDLFVNFTVGFEWASWTEYEMSRADWIIFVCSKSSCDLLHPHDPKVIEVFLPSVKKVSTLDTAVGEVAKKVKFSGKILYNRLLNETKSKIVAVVLREEDKNYVLPIFQDPQNVLHIYEDRPFDYDKLDGHFERLICRMADINRISLMNSSRIQSNGYIKLKSKIPQKNNYWQPVDKQVAQPETEPQVFANSQFRHAEVAPNTSYQMQRQPSYLQQPAVYSCSNQYALSEKYKPTVGTSHVPIEYRSQALYMSPYMATPQYSTENVAVQRSYGKTQQSKFPPGQQYVNNISANQYSALPFSGTKKARLPSSKIPADSLILWKLSLEVREWKFVARYLDLDEDVIEEIDIDTIPNKTREKSLKVFTEWVNRSPEATWAALGEVLLETENMLLYEKLLDLVAEYSV